jgi:RNA polymerase sigma-70 factor (ECF subfamily)
MKFSSSTATSPTLLGRLRSLPNDQAAWHEFVDRYGPRVFAWCRHWNLSAEDAEDVTQNVLLRLAKQLRTFVYDPSASFRGWLRTLTQHALADFLAHGRKPDRASGSDEVWDVLNTVEARTTLVERLEVEFDQEVFAEATARVQLRVQPHNWQAFQLTTQEGLSGAEVAERLELNVTAVFKAKSRVIELLQQEIQRLNATTGWMESP